MSANPETLVRLEALTPLLNLVEPDSAAADHILHQLCQDGRTLAQVDSGRPAARC